MNQLLISLSLSFLCLCVSVVQPLHAQDHRQTERECRERLKDPHLSSDERAAVTARLAASLAQQAVSAAQPASRDQFWDGADLVLHDFVRLHPGHGQAPFVLRQRAIYAWIRGEGLRQQAELANSPEVLVQAQKHLQQAERLAAALEIEVQKQLEMDRTKNGPIPFDHMAALANEMRLRLGQARLSLAQTYESGGGERDRLLAAATKSLQVCTRDGFQNDEATIRAFLTLAECHRLRGELALAQRVLAPLEAAANLPPDVREKATALKVNVLLDQKQPQAARALLKGRVRLSADLALAEVRALLQEASLVAGSSPAEASRLQAEAMRRIAVGEKEFPAGWGARASLILGRDANPDLVAEDIDGNVHLAESFHRAGRQEAALTSYERALALAEKTGDRERSFTLGMEAARIREQVAGPGESAWAFLKLAENAPNPAAAAKASLLAAHSLRRKWEKDHDPATLARLRDLMDRHLSAHADDSTVAEAHFLAGYVDAAFSRWQPAIDHFGRIPDTHRLFPLAIQETVKACEALQSSLPRQEAEGAITRVLSHFRQLEARLITQPEAALPRQEVQLGLARLRLRRGARREEYAAAADMLQRLLQEPAAPASVQLRARGQLPLALWGAGKEAEAMQRIKGEADSEAIRILHGALAGRTTEEEKSALASLELAVLDRLLEPRSDLPDLWSAKAWALARLGKKEEARRMIAAGRQHDEEKARILSYLGMKEDLEEAIRLWQRIAAGRQEGTVPWLEARYQLALVLKRAGHDDRARKVARAASELWLSDRSLDAQEQELLGRLGALEQTLKK